MRSTDVSEGGLEALIVAALTGAAPARPSSTLGFSEDTAPFSGPDDYIEGRRDDYDRAYALDLAQLAAFIHTIQPDLVGPLSMDADTPVRRAFLARVRDEITARGAIDVLRAGVRHGPHEVKLYFPLPSPGNTTATAHFAANRFSVTRQLGYSLDTVRRALDLGLFINGLPLATFELKNSLTGQTAAHAEAQYKTDRDPKELIFRPGRCAVHFAVDDREVRMCSQLAGTKSWFLPFNRGWNDGAGNPPNPDGLKTDYLWRQVLTKRSLADIVENFACIVKEQDTRGRVTASRPIFPRYHQLGVVRALCADALQRGVGRRYLIQHSAGSGKSNSIAWTVHKLVGLERAGKSVFDTVIVVTDRHVLDKNLKDTIGGFTQTARLMGHAEHAGDLRTLIASGKKVVVTTIQKFPWVLDDIGNARGNRFAIVIDEAHSSQGGRAAGKLNSVLGGTATDDEMTTEDRILAIIEGRRMLDNASYFAFTATPKNRTLELFGDRHEQGGMVKHRPFHLYSMKQAIEEKFILDVLAHYTPVSSYYRIAKTAADDPEVDVSQTLKTLRHYVEGHDHAIATKAGIVVDHFLDHVIAPREVGGEARAIMAVDGIERAIEYWRAIQAALAKRGSPYRAIVAFSGTFDDAGQQRTEASFNGFPSADLENRFDADPYRFLVVADKYLTGFDQPKLFAMYVDKPLAGVKAVQALSRLNRARPPDKGKPFVLDFRNDPAVIEAAFATYYRTTILSGETDPNKLHDLKRSLDAAMAYDERDVETVVTRFLGKAERDQLDPILDTCSARYEELSEDGQVAFKGAAKTFVRTYAFLSAILRYAVPEWEKLATFLTLLIPKLPSPAGEQTPEDVVESIDMDSYRVEVKAKIAIILADADAEIEPAPTGAACGRPEPDIDHLSRVIQDFNDRFGTAFSDEDRIRRFMFEELPAKIDANSRVQNALRNSDDQNAEIELGRAVDGDMLGGATDQTELYALYNTNEAFKSWLRKWLFANAKRKRNSALHPELAEGVGFEPTVRVNAHTLSKRAP